MKYKNLNVAFLFEILIGLGCILSISLLGSKGMVSLAIIAIRPFVLEKEPIKNEKQYWQFSYKIMFNSVVIISLMIISILLIVQFFPLWKLKLPSYEVLIIELIPFFILTHGVIGFINFSVFEKHE